MAGLAVVVPHGHGLPVQFHVTICDVVPEGTVVVGAAVVLVVGAVVVVVGAVVVVVVVGVVVVGAGASVSWKENGLPLCTLTYSPAVTLVMVKDCPVAMLETTRCVDASGAPA